MPLHVYHRYKNLLIKLGQRTEADFKKDEKRVNQLLHLITLRSNGLNDAAMILSSIMVTPPDYLRSRMLYRNFAPADIDEAIWLLEEQNHHLAMFALDVALDFWNPEPDIRTELEKACKFETDRVSQEIQNLRAQESETRHNQKSWWQFWKKKK